VRLPTFGRRQGRRVHADRRPVGGRGGQGEATRGRPRRVRPGVGHGRGDGLQDEVGAAVGPRALELVRDPALGGPDTPIVGERGPSAVAGETFERLAVVIGDDDAACNEKPSDHARRRSVPRTTSEVAVAGERQVVTTSA
jgi:hypothetical protein